MSAPHFFVEDLTRARAQLTGEDARHAARVLRLRPGDAITVADDRGGMARARLVEGGSDGVEVELLERWSVDRAAPRLVACPAVPKSGKLELEVQKLTELGVDEIRPWVAARTVPRWDEAKAARHGERLRLIAREAAKQSRRAFLPVVADPSVLATGSSSEELLVVCHEAAPGGLLEQLPHPPPAVVTVITGPEGGLDEAEIGAFREAGALLATLGPTILRAETAILAAVTLVSGRYGRLG